MDRVLEAWVEDDRRRPLLIRGARQVGKTYAVTALGERRFADVASINLERQPRYRRCFDTLEPRAILDQIGVLRGKPVEPGRTLLFIDEIQECPAAVMALRYFYEQVPELHVIGAGSLLEFALEAERLPMPVGRIQPLFMHPLSFAEFLPAVGEEPALQASRTLAAGAGTAVHEHLIALLRTYLLLGGMPAVVAEYLETGSVARATRIQTAITQTFRDDFGKYARASRHHLLDRVFLHAARMVGRKFMYSKVDPDSRYERPELFYWRRGRRTAAPRSTIWWRRPVAWCGRGQGGKAGRLRSLGVFTEHYRRRSRCASTAIAFVGTATWYRSRFTVWSACSPSWPRRSMRVGRALRGRRRQRPAGRGDPDLLVTLGHPGQGRTAVGQRLFGEDEAAPAGTLADLRDDLPDRFPRDDVGAGGRGNTAA